MEKVNQLVDAINLGIKYAGQNSRKDKDNEQSVAYHAGVIDANRQTRELIGELWGIELRHWKEEL